jgi:ferredoxin
VRRDQGVRLRLDPTACTGHGLCAVLLAERVGLDEWGYPLIAPGPLEPGLLDAARDAAYACPTRALRLTRPA